MRRAVIYEDQRAAATKGFGPHELLIRCILDDHPDAKAEEWRLRSAKEGVAAIPKKGIDKLLTACGDADDYADFASKVFALVDDDKLDEHLARHPRIRSPEDAPLVSFHRLKANVETLVEASLFCCGKPKFATKPTPLERDIALGEASLPETRRCMRERVPTWDAFVKDVAAWVLGEPVAPAH